jgi:methyl-accepting chemotaxis protein-2 (aspartate sensor receptor)
LREKIGEVKLGSSGYAYVLDAGKEKGKMIVHPTLEGKNLYDDKDDNGLPYIRTIIEQKNGTLKYWFVDQASGKAREKIAIFEYFPWWDWIIVSTMDHDEMISNAVYMRNALIVGAVVLCVVLSVIIFFTSRRWVTKPLAEAVSAMKEMADGRLAIEIPERGDDEVGHLLTATRVMAGKMRSALSDVRAVAQQLSDHSKQVLDTANEVVRQSTQQSDSALTMASSVEEMNVNLVNVSDSAQQTSQISIDSARVSNEGSVVIRQATDSITRIAETVRTASGIVRALGEESQAISRIVEVIREIAEQTNLLALNAAIEAARAGEHGRGFAVVADEVRKLAERTAGSTQEISSMIQRILEGTSNAVSSMDAGVTQVEEGVSYAGQAGESIASIRESSDQVTTSVTSISKALMEQSEAITGISHSIEQIATMADQNSQTAKESAECALELEQLADTLQERISRFSI